MSFTVTPGYVFNAGETVTATKLNLDGSPTIADGQSYPFGIGTAAAPSISFSSSTSSAATGFYFANPGVGVAYLGVQSALFTNYLQIFNGDNTTGSGAISQLGFGYNGAAQYRHFIQTRHQSIAAGSTGNSFAFWVNTSVATGASNAAGTGNILAMDVTGAGVALLGSNSSGDAGAGYVGEILSQTIVAVSAVSLSTGVQANVATITLTAGDWDVTGTIQFAFGSGTTVAYARASVSTTTGTVSATSPSAWNSGGSLSDVAGVGTGGAGASAAIPTTRMTIANGATTQIWLVTQSAFSVSTLGAFGLLRARRMR